MAKTISFEADDAGTGPSGWTVGVTGRGTHRWTVESDASAPSQPLVLKQSGRGDFPRREKNEPQIADGYAEVKFVSLSQEASQPLNVLTHPWPRLRRVLPCNQKSASPVLQRGTDSR